MLVLVSGPLLVLEYNSVHCLFSLVTSNRQRRTPEQIQASVCWRPCHILFGGCEGRLPFSVPIIGSALTVCNPSHWPPAACNWPLAARSKRENPLESLRVRYVASQLLMYLCRMMCICALPPPPTALNHTSIVTPLLESSLPDFVTIGLVLIQELPHCVLPKTSFKMPHE